jgi:hypothetical protein
MGPKASLAAVHKTEISCPCRKSKGGFSIVQDVANSKLRLTFPSSSLHVDVFGVINYNNEPLLVKKNVGFDLSFVHI